MHIDIVIRHSTGAVYEDPTSCFVGNFSDIVERCTYTRHIGGGGNSYYLRLAVFIGVEQAAERCEVHNVIRIVRNKYCVG
jgi:hypothetical protein